MSKDPNTVAEVIALLEADDVTSACEAVESWAKAGRVQLASELADALENECPDEKKRRARFEAVADHVEDQLALVPGREAIDTILALSLRTRERSVVRPRTRSMRVSAFASRLGFGQSAEDFLSALERASEKAEHQEIFACWTQEAVLREQEIGGDARAKHFQATLAAAGHPLASLPLSLLPPEREAPSYLPLYGDRGLGNAIETLASGSMSIRTIPPPADGAAIRATRHDDASLTNRMSAAVRPWAEGKSGKLEAKVFTLEPKVDASAFGSWLLRALPLDSTSAVARLDCSRAAAEGVFGPLFAAASNGGAYSSGLGGAYGRLAAWNSLGALVDAPPEAPVDDVAALAARCAFLLFRAPGPWFHDVAWDLGAIALRPDGASAAVLAATDTE